MRTADSVSPIAAPAVAASLVAFIVVYFIVFGAGIWYLLHLFRQPPHPHEEGPAARRADAHRRHHAGARRMDANRREGGATR